MRKTVIQALVDDVHYPISYGFVENVAIRRGLADGEDYSAEVAESISYKGALAIIIDNKRYKYNGK